MQRNKLLILLLCSLFLLPRVVAQSPSCVHKLEFRVEFRIGQDLLLKEYKNNTQQLDSLCRLLGARDRAVIDSIVFVGSASPEGSVSLNKGLALRRARSVRGYLVWRFPYVNDVPSRLIVSPRDWSGVLDYMKGFDSIPNGAQVISMIESHSDDPMVMERVRSLSAAAYSYIINRILSDKRDVTACVIYYSEPLPVDSTYSDLAIVDVPLHIDSVASPSSKEEPQEIALPIVESTPAQPLTSAKRVRRRPNVALKTDLMLWGGVMPNFQIGTWTPNITAEIYFADRWSAQFGWSYSYWDALTGSRELFATSAGDLEVRRWLGRKSLHQGLFVGLYGVVGEYDVQDGMGVTLHANTGSFWRAGIGLGWLVPMAHHWAFEGQIRGGFRSAANSFYDFEDGHYYFNSGSVVGKVDIQLRMSLVYRFAVGRKARVL